MFETINYLNVATRKIPDSALVHFKTLRDSIHSQSLIVWGEHCSECAFPACYSTCALYTPRHDDMNCGRFTHGIQKEKNGNLRLATINFRKWGKLFGRGPVSLVDAEKAQKHEKINDVISSAIAHYAPSIIVRRLNWEWDKRKSLTGDVTTADAFIFEAWGFDEVNLNFTLTIIPENPQNNGLFQSNVVITAGYNQNIIPLDEISELVDLSQPFSIQIEPLEDSLYYDVTFGIIDFVKFHKRLGEILHSNKTATKSQNHAKNPKAKCVVWDLDNTIWQGTLAEDGKDNLVLNPIIKSTIEELDQRGILQSIASKNDLQPALEALKLFDLKKYFLYPQVSWEPKSVAIKQIAKQLDIGIDTFIFIDDQPFERGEVQEHIPTITVLPHTEIPSLLSNPLVDVPVTKESKKRRAMYMAEQNRQSTFQNNSSNYVDFLRGCEIEIIASKLSSKYAERAYELSQRTNQLNVSGRRYQRKEIEALQKPNSKNKAYIFSCRDRFGDYGIIAMCVIDLSVGHIESFMMSCRVQRKLVEHSIFWWLCSKCSVNNLDEISVDYRKTARNQASMKMLKELGFIFLPTGEDTGQFKRDVNTAIEKADIVRIQEAN